MSDAQVAIGIRAVALASTFLVRKLRDPEFMATIADGDDEAPVAVAAVEPEAVPQG